ncbi:MAG: hypothetical protein IIZ53_04630 [Ruminococcus sp.]|nr:hypothetical protein [Ruminococcus sp.]
MENFKKKIKFRFQLCTMYMCSGTMLYFLLQRLTENVPDFSKGMLTGLLVGGDLLALIYMIRCCILLRDEKKLKEEYIKSTDERNNEISKETMRTASVITLMCTSLAIIITGFFSITVSMTLFIDLTVSTLIVLLVNAFYKKKM